MARLRPVRLGFGVEARDPRRYPFVDLVAAGYGGIA